MNGSDVPTPVVQAFALFGRFYRSWTIDESVIVSWWMLLSDVPPEAFLRAAAEHARTSKFPPTPAEIRELALRPDQERLPAEEAWSEVMGEIKRVGWIGTPRFSNPQVERAARALGSWRSLCSQTSDQLAANRAHFMRFYGAMAKTADREQQFLEADKIVAAMLGPAKTREEKTQALYGCTPDEADEPYRERNDAGVRSHRLADEEDLGDIEDVA